MTKTEIIVCIVIILAAFLRFYKLGDIPPSLTWDEAAWGYNAYSLGKDARDEFGRFLPITYLESFGDFKPPLYAYLSIIPIKIFGLTEFGTRFASAFFGVLTILLTYFLVKKIFAVNSKSQILNSKRSLEFKLSLNSKQFQISNFKFQIKEIEIVALLASFILAISPWHILLSRAAFEANVATFFIILGVLLFLISTSPGAASKTPLGWFSSAPAALTLSVASFVLSMYTFNTARVVAPLLLLGLIIGKRKEVLRIKKQFSISLLFGFLIFLPLFLFLLTPQAKLRFREVNIFSDIDVVKRVNQQIELDYNAWWSKVIHNRRFAYAVEYLKHYFDNLSPSFLFIKGDGNPKFSIQDVGQLYLWEIPFFVAGCFLLFRKRTGAWWVVPYWLVVGIIPAATARETPHALRIEAALPTFQILTAYGLYNLISNFKYQISNIKFRTFVAIIFLSVVIFNILYFFHNYFVHYSKEFSGEWQYGYKDAISYIQSVEKNYDKIYFTESLGRPYIYILFHTQYDPKKFRSLVVAEREALGFVNVRSFDKYHFTKDFLSSYHVEKKILYIDTPSKVHKKSKILKKFFLLNGNSILAAYVK